MAGQASWRLFCSHGTILFYIARHSGCTTREIADGLMVTQRTAWGLMNDLKRAGLIEVRREGRLHRYSINGDARLPDPVLSHLTLGQLVAVLVG